LKKELRTAKEENREMNSILTDQAREQKHQIEYYSQSPREGTSRRGRTLSSEKKGSDSEYEEFQRRKY